MNFETFRNHHEGNSILVCGLGESINFLTPHVFGDEIRIIIGCNDIGRKFQPTYLLNVNLKTQYIGDRFQYIENSEATALFTHLPKEQGAIKIPIVEFQLAEQGGVEVVNGKVPHFWNTPYMGVVLAAYMGASKIGLIGVDFTDGHFWTKDGPHHLVNTLKDIDEGYRRLFVHLRSKGIEFVNLSPVSRLTSIPKADLKTWN